MQKHRERIDLMARKDKRGRNLREGESQRKDGLYMYRYTDRKSGKRTAIYDADLAALREKEWKIAQDMDAGIVTERAAKKMTVNTLFERYMESKKLADSTRGNYISTWNNRVRDEIGMMKVVQVRSSHVKLFYAQLTKEGYSHSMVKLIHNLLYPSFEGDFADALTAAFLEDTAVRVFQFDKARCQALLEEPDAAAFCARAREHELLLVPSDSFGIGGYVRISYCVARDVIERSLPAFAALMQTYRT